MHGTASLRFHPRCYYRPDPDSPTETWPAMIAAVTDIGGTITGAHRTWLGPSGRDKAPIDTPRRAMGHLLGNAVRLGLVHDVMAAGEGNADGIDLIVPDWFYRAVLDDALVLTIDPAYFSLTGGLERWLYRIVRKHGGQQRGGWKFDFRHLYAKSASLSPFRRFAFELRDLARRQPLPGYCLRVQRETGGRELLLFGPTKLSTSACGQAGEPNVRSGTNGDVPFGTGQTCYSEPKPLFSSIKSAASGVGNLESNLRESNSSEVGPRADRWITAKRAR